MCEPGNISRRRSRSSCSSQRPCSKTENKQFMTKDQLASKIYTTTKGNNSNKEQQQKRSNNNNKCSPPCSQRQTGPCPACRKQWADPSGPAKSKNHDHFLLFHFMFSQRNFTNGSCPRRCFLYITMTNTITSHLVVLVGKAEPLVKGDRAVPVLVDGLEHVSRASLHNDQIRS